MISYLIRRLLLVIPTLIGIMLINFAIVQAAPGGPVDQMIARLQGHGGAAMSNVTGGGGSETISGGRSRQGLSPEIIARIEKMYGFDKPVHERLMDMLVNYARFDFGESFYHSTKVIDLVLEKMPVSISLGLWSTLAIYFISIPLGIRKAVSHGSRFDAWSGTFITIGYAIPGFLFAIIMVVLFAGGSYFSWFPLRGMVSDDFGQLSLVGKLADYFWHLVLPLTAYTIGGFATLTMLSKNSFLDEINKQYVLTARAKGVDEHGVLYGHVFRNAMLIIISGFPAAFVAIFFSQSLLIEAVFSLDGLGLLGYESILSRDYPVFFGTLYIFTLIGLVIKIISDMTYVLVDPRIDFEGRD